MLPSETSWWTSSSGLPSRDREPVRRVEPLGGVGDHARDRERIEARAALGGGPQHVEERLALEVLHRDEVPPVRLAEIVDLDDVRVLDQRGEPRLVEQHLDERRVASRGARARRLMTTSFSKPAGPRCTARCTSAIPPRPIGATIS